MLHMAELDSPVTQCQGVIFACRSWSTLAVSTVSEVACPAEETARADSEAWTVNSVATLYNLSVPFKAAATAAAGSTSGLLYCYG